MLKNLKHSILYILLASMLLLLVAVSLAASRSESGLKSGAKSGLGMGMFSWSPASTFNGWVDTLLANGFTDLRIDIPSYQDTAWVAESKICVLSALAKGANVIWGVSSNKFNNPGWAITSANWPTFRQAILDAARWAQDNGVTTFTLGNEEEWHVDGTTMTVAQIQSNIKALATDVQAVFTRGDVIYTTSVTINGWHNIGRGDLDILAFNIYGNEADWQSDVTNMVSWFGADHTYITEFNIALGGVNNYSSDEAAQAARINEMINYIRTAGINKAYFFCYRCNSYGAMETDGTYRSLWDTLTSYNNII